MKKILLLSLLALTSIAVILFVVFREPHTPAGADIVPASSLLFVRAPDMARSRVALASSALGQLWREPEMQAFTAKPMNLLRESTGIGSGDDANEWALSWITKFLLDAQQGETFMAVTHVHFLPPQIGVVMGADVKRRRVMLAANLADLKGRIQSKYPSLTLTSKSFMGTSYDVWRIKPGTDVCQAFLGDMLVFTLGESTMRDTIARANDRPANGSPSLAESLSFQRVTDALPANHEFVAYLNFGPIRDILQPMLLMSGQGSQAIQKLSGLDAAGLCASITSNTVTDTLIVTHRDKSPTPSPSVSWRTRSLTTPQTMFYATFTSDWRQSYRDTKNSVAQSDNAKGVAAIAALEKNLATQNIDIENDLLAFLGPETGLTIDWTETSSQPDIALAIELRDAGNVRPRIATLLQHLRDQPSVTESNQVVIGESSTVNGADLVSIKLRDYPMMPTLAVTDNFLILASSDNHARSLIDRMRERPPTLSDNPDYIDAMNRLTNSGHAYLYFDLAQLTQRGHPLLQQTLRSMPPNEFIDATAFPSATTFARHLSPMVIGSHTATNGQTTTMISPMGSATILIGVIATAIVQAGNVIAEMGGTGITGSWPTPFSGKDVPPSPPARREAGSGNPSSR